MLPSKDKIKDMDEKEMQEEGTLKIPKLAIN